MRSRFILCLLFLSVAATAQNPVQTGEFLYTVPLNKFITAHQVQTQWWHEYLEPQQNEAFFRPLFNAIDSGRAAVFRPEYPFTAPLTQAEAHQLLHPVETVTVYDVVEEVKDIEVEFPVLPVRIISVTFHERWQYNPESKTLQKTVLGLIPHILILDQYTGAVSARPLFYIPFKPAAAASSPQVNGITYDLSFGDTAHFYHIPGCALTFPQKTQLAAEEAFTKNILQTAAVGKKQRLYEPGYPFTTRLKTFPAEQPDGLRFFESWSMDLSAMCFTKTVHGVVLLQQSSGSPKPLVFVPLNGFSPAPPVIPKQVNIDTISCSLAFVPVQTMERQLLTHVDTTHLRKTLGVYCDLVKQQKLQSFGVFSGRPLSRQGTDSLFSVYERLEYFDPVNPDIYVDTLIVYPLDYYRFGGWQFCERWSYDASRQHFSKTIYRTAPLVEKMDEIGMIYALYPLLLVEAPLADSTLARPEFLVAENISVPVQLDYTIERASLEYAIAPDSVVLPYTTDHFSNLEPSARYQLVRLILADAQAGKIACTDSLGKVIPPKQLRRQLDSLRGSSFAGEVALFNLLIFEENWYFNPATGQFYKQVSAVTFAHGTATTPRRKFFTVRLKP